MKRVRMGLCLSLARSFLFAAKFSGDKVLAIESAKAQIKKYYRIKSGELV